MNTMERITRSATALACPSRYLPTPRNASSMTLMGVLLASTLGLSSVTVAQSARAADDLAVRKSSDSFLQVYRPKLVLSADNPALPQFCSKRRCPQIVSNYGAFPSATIDDITSGYKNVRVSMYINSISNTAVEGGGVDAGIDGFVWWNTSSADADEEDAGPYAWTLPGPGETFDNFGPHDVFFGMRVYDALVVGACGGLTSFDIGHSAEIEDGGSQVALFKAADNSTINSTGYYNVDYSVTVADGAGGVSDFRFRGKLNVLCSGLVDLP